MHASLFVISLDNSLIRADKLDGWGVTDIQKDKVLSIHARYIMAKHSLQPHTFKHCQNHIQVIANYHKVYTPRYNSTS